MAAGGRTGWPGCTSAPAPKCPRRPNSAAALTNRGSQRPANTSIKNKASMPLLLKDLVSLTPCSSALSFFMPSDASQQQPPPHRAQAASHEHLQDVQVDAASGMH